MVLSEPFGRIEARTTYGKVPPRKRPALGRRYRPEQDFSSGLRRRDDRRTGIPDPCSAALHGRVLKASSEKLGKIMIGFAYVFFGIYLIAFPVLGEASLGLVLASLFLLEGIFDIAMFLRLRAIEGSSWVLLDGIVTLILGLMS